MSKKGRSKKGLDYDHPHVYVATPAYDGKVDSDYAQSLSESAQAATVFGIYFSAEVMMNGAFIDLARNTFVQRFLTLSRYKACTHLFFIDADLKWQSSAFVNLILHCTEDRPVVAGAYRRRQEPEEYPIVWAPEPGHDDDIDRLWLIDGWLQCNRVATGFLCIRRNVLEEMVKGATMINQKNQDPVPRLFYTFLDEDGRFVGEDFAWCDDYRKRFDRKIDVWPDFDFVHGGREGNYAKWLNKMVDESASEKPERRKLGTRRVS